MPTLPIEVSQDDDHALGGRTGSLPAAAEKLVYLITSAPKFGDDLAQQIRHFGYQVQVVGDFTAIENVIAMHTAIAIVVDIPSTRDRVAESNIFNEINATYQPSLPLVFISDRDDQVIRLKAIRAGGAAFFKKPIDIVALIDKLDALRKSEVPMPYRVLIVEDQPTIGNYYQMVLKMASMNTCVVNDSMRVLSAMEEFLPDLILMDLYMPGSNGVELAKLIRQIDEFVSIPIVFLSSEDDFSKQMQAMSWGGDDFLTKPIKAGHLVAIVNSRLERLQILRSYMVRDSLTSLLNHTATRSQFKQELSRCRRQNTKMALAMLVLDHFKRVNDTYGHPTGDTVLKSLSRLLKQRLRSSDILGRHGGEEFVVGLLDVDNETAFKVLDEIRQHFSEIQHMSSNMENFSVTLSAGFAAFPEIPNISRLYDAADKALYQAKRAGRNRVVAWQKKEG